MDNKIPYISYVIFAASLLVIPFFIFQIIYNMSNLSSQLFSGLMIICSIIAATLIVSYWRDVKKGKE